MWGDRNVGVGRGGGGCFQYRILYHYVQEVCTIRFIWGHVGLTVYLGTCGELRFPIAFLDLVEELGFQRTIGGIGGCRCASR